MGRELLTLWSLRCCNCLVCDSHGDCCACALLFPLASGAESADRKSIYIRYAISRDARHLGAVDHQVAPSGEAAPLTSGLGCDSSHGFVSCCFLLSCLLQVKSFFSILAIVNFNTDMFQLPCLFGSSQPVSKALLTAASPFAASACGLVILPVFLTICSRFNTMPLPAGQLVPKTLEDCCAISNKGDEHFAPQTAYGVATWTEAILICFVVSA